MSPIDSYFLSQEYLLNHPTASTEGMPNIFRVTSISHKQEARCVRYTANIYHDKVSLKVEWTRSQPDTRLRPFCLVSPRWNIRPSSENGVVQISRLILMEHPEPQENLFHLVPPGWVSDRELVEQGISLMKDLPRPYRFLFNAIFWNGERFRRFCMGPSSMNAHHNYDNGNLIHSIELALMMRDALKETDLAKHALAVMVGLLHDAGKADEYQFSPKGEWILTDRGKLLGHHNTIVEWIAAAYARYPLHNLPKEHYEALLHCLTCHAYAPDWLGLRRPMMREANLLSGLDQFSGQDDLMRRCTTNRAGWGNYHSKLKGGKPYQIDPLMMGFVCGF